METTIELVKLKQFDCTFADFCKAIKKNLEKIWIPIYINEHNLAVRYSDSFFIKQKAMIWAYLGETLIF